MQRGRPQKTFSRGTYGVTKIHPLLDCSKTPAIHSSFLFRGPLSTPCAEQDLRTSVNILSRGISQAPQLTRSRRAPPSCSARRCCRTQGSTRMSPWCGRTGPCGCTRPTPSFPSANQSGRFRVELGFGGRGDGERLIITRQRGGFVQGETLGAFSQHS